MVDSALTENVTFLLNGEEKILRSPDPRLMLIDYLRSPEIGLSGSKKPCGQGGCGGCGVILSKWDPATKAAAHDPINSCLRPVIALNGMSVTTIEGTGRIESQMNKVAYRLAVNNGTQCGYCTTGWVMAMTGYLVGRKDKPTKQDIEDSFDGNICRCTGYRSILEGMKTFASDWTEADEENRMKCFIDPTFDANSVAPHVTIPFSPDQINYVDALNVHSHGVVWREVYNLAEFQKAFNAMHDRSSPVRFVNGNTSFGIYKEEIEETDAMIDIRNMCELKAMSEFDGYLEVGAGITYSELLDYLHDVDLHDNSALGAVKYMAQRTAGTLVRNVATIGGNTMLVANHIKVGEPFPSDLVTILCGLGAEVDLYTILDGKTQRVRLLEMLLDVGEDWKPDGQLILRYYIPIEAMGAAYAQKTALREVNAHSIVNMGSVIDAQLDGKTAKFKSVSIVLNGFGTRPFRAVETEQSMHDKPVNEETITAALAALERDAKNNLLNKERALHFPDEGFSLAYKISLSKGFLYKAIINAQIVSGVPVPENVRSAGVSKWGKWGVSGGSQSYQTDQYKLPLSKPYIKLMALYQSQGEVRYTHEIIPKHGSLFGALISTTTATGGYHIVGTEATGSEALSFARRKLKTNSGFRALISWDNIPEYGSNMQGMGGDQPLFLQDSEPIMFAGQTIAMVLASDQKSADALAKYARENLFECFDKSSPILTIEAAVEEGQIFPDCPASASYLAHIWKVTRPKSDLAWAHNNKKTALIDGHPCAIVSSVQNAGGQLHFYMETQACVAEPLDGGVLLIRASTQSPKTVQGAVASTLNLSHNQVGVQVPQVGGAYGGKTEQSRLVSSMAALGAYTTGKPVHLLLDRETDSALIGKRHPYYGTFKLAVDNGTQDSNNKGKLIGLFAEMIGDGGAYYDCSFVVSDCMQLRIDSSYYVPHYQTQIDVCRTNTSPNTAYRSFGDIQATLMLENAIENAAVVLNMDAAELRAMNLYQQDQTTPGGQVLNYCYQKEVWDYCRRQSNYDERKAAVDQFNVENKWRKRGICLMPLKYGSGFNLAMLEQTTALVSIYEADGTILVRQGGTDMGQGMLTKLTQIAAYSLNVPIEFIRVETADTRVIPNPSSTGASTGTQFSGRAIMQACEVLKKRLTTYCLGKGDDWARSLGMTSAASAAEDWHGNYTDQNGETKATWAAIVKSAFSDCVNLQAQEKAVAPGGTGLVPNVAFKSKDKQPLDTGIPIDERGAFSETIQEYVGFTYNAACSEVEVDILTGETKTIRVDIIYDMGKSLNPAIDVGQIEGAFMQGVGYILTENVIYQPDNAGSIPAGTLVTKNTWRYKPPAISTVPLVMNVRLFPRELAKDVPENPNDLFSSKEVGEPPMVLANTVFFAIKSAVRSSRMERKLPEIFEMTSPASVQTIVQACEVTGAELAGG